MYLQPAREKERDSGENKFFLVQLIATSIIITTDQGAAFPMREGKAWAGKWPWKIFVFIKTSAKIELHWLLL